MSDCCTGASGEVVAQCRAAVRWIEESERASCDTQILHYATRSNPALASALL